MENNSRKMKFEELAEKRTNEVIKRIRLIGKLANKSNYSYTTEHANQIIKALEEEIKLLKNKFQNDHKDLPLFKFSIKSSK